MVDFSKVFDELPGNYLILKADGPKFTMEYANKAHLRNLKMKPEDLHGKGIFEVFIDVNGSLDTIKNCLEEVIKTKTFCKPPRLRYDVPIDKTGKFEERYWDLEYTPLLSASGEVEYIIQTALDITRLVQLGFPF